LNIPFVLGNKLINYDFISFPKNFMSISFHGGLTAASQFSVLSFQFPVESGAEADEAVRVRARGVQIHVEHASTGAIVPAAPTDRQTLSACISIEVCFRLPREQSQVLHRLRFLAIKIDISPLASVIVSINFFASGEGNFSFSTVESDRLFFAHHRLPVLAMI